MQATGNNAFPARQQSIRVTADGLSFYPGPESVSVCGNSTRVPMAEFRRDEAETLLAFVAGTPQQPQTVLYNVLPELETVEIFAISSDVLQTIRTEYPSHRIMGANAMVLETMWRYDRSNGSSVRRLYVWTHDDEMLVFAYDSEGLQWANTFKPQTLDERMFFVLTAWRTLGMDAEKDECLCICDNELSAAMRPYLRHSTALSPAEVLGAERAARDVPFDIQVL